MGAQHQFWDQDWNRLSTEIWTGTASSPGCRQELSPVTGTRTGTGSALGPREAQDKDLDQEVTQPRDQDQDWPRGLRIGTRTGIEGSGPRPAQHQDPEGLGPSTRGLHPPPHPSRSPYLPSGAHAQVPAALVAEALAQVGRGALGAGGELRARGG